MGPEFTDSGYIVLGCGAYRIGSRYFCRGGLAKMGMLLLCLATLFLRFHFFIDGQLLGSAPGVTPQHIFSPVLLFFDPYFFVLPPH